MLKEQVPIQIVDVYRCFTPKHYILSIRRCLDLYVSITWDSGLNSLLDNSLPILISFLHNQVHFLLRRLPLELKDVVRLVNDQDLVPKW